MADLKEDRRIQRTRITLRTAMVSLIREKGFEALTVQDIIDRANVGRSTFYAHFKGKEELLTGSLDLLRSQLRRLQLVARGAAPGAVPRLFGFSRDLIAHAEQHRDVLAAMSGKRSGTVFQNYFHRMLVDLVHEDVNTLPARKVRDAARVEAAVQFVAGGLLGLLVSWLDRMPNATVDEIDTRFHAMAGAAVESLLG